MLMVVSMYSHMCTCRRYDSFEHATFPLLLYITCIVYYCMQDFVSVYSYGQLPFLTYLNL